MKGISPQSAARLRAIVQWCFVFRNFWCRYLCPYGALLGLASLASPFKVSRDGANCTGCERCSASCPSALAVHSRLKVSSPECTGCLTCVAHCPGQNVLAMQPLFWKRPLPVWVFPAVLLLIFTGTIALGMVSGHWQSSLTPADYRQLIPRVPYLNH